MSAQNPPFFFPSTQSVNARLGDTFGFVWASYAGLRELWWQVRGFSTQFQGIHIDEIKSKFLSGLPLPGGIDLRRVCLTTDWPQHEAEFAKWILFEACTLYENWAEKVCTDIFPSASAARHAKNIQFPTGTDKKGNLTGYKLAINAANANSSQLMLSEFYQKLSTSKLNRSATIEDHLLAYRFFKECRNSIIHSGGEASQDLILLHSALVSAQAKNPSPFRHAFSLPTPIVGEKIPLHIKDCILFATIVRLLICTFDAALCVTKSSERILESRLREAIKKNTALQSLPSDPQRRTQRIRRILVAARVPSPVNIDNVAAWMQDKHII